MSTNFQKLTGCLLALILLLSMASLSLAEEKTTAPAKAQPKLAVKTLSGKGVDKATAATLTDLLCTKIAAGKSYNVLCASDLKAILKASEQTALLGACEDGKCDEKLMKAIDSQFILNGTVGKVEGTYVISLSLLSDKGVVVKRVSLETDKGNLIEGVKKAGEKLLK